MKFSSKNFDLENVQFLGLFVLAIFFVYKAPFILNQFFFIAILILTFISKKDYFWIAFFFLLIDAPGRLFAGGDITDVHRLAFYKVFAGITINFTDLYFLAMIIKLIKHKKNYYFKFKKDIIFILAFGFFIVIYSLILGTSGQNIVQSMRILLGWSLFFIIPRFILTDEDYDRLLKLLYPVVFLAIISQLYSYISGNYFAYFLKGETFDSRYLLIEGDEGLSRAAESSIILLFCFVNALFNIYSNNRIFNKPYLYFVISLSLISVVLSATRGWILCYILIIILSFIFISESKRMLKIIASVSLVFLILSILYPPLLRQLQASYERMQTIQSLAGGDLTAQGTLQRLDERGPAVLSIFYEKPLLGWGFSDNYFSFVDPHVGHHSLLLNVGILGFIIFNILFIKWCININKIKKLMIQVNGNKMKSINIFIFILLGVFVIHSSSAQAWGFDIKIGSLILYSLILQKVNLLYLSCFRQ